MLPPYLCTKAYRNDFISLLIVISWPNTNSIFLLSQSLSFWFVYIVVFVNGESDIEIFIESFEEYLCEFPSGQMCGTRREESGNSERFRNIGCHCS